MEPKNKESEEWREWFVRHNFGATTAGAIKIATKEELLVLQKFVADILKVKN